MAKITHYSLVSGRTAADMSAAVQLKIDEPVLGESTSWVPFGSAQADVKNNGISQAMVRYEIPSLGGGPSDF